MPQFDVYRLASGDLVVDCQDDGFATIGTRFVIPLAAPGGSAPTTPRLHPEFRVNGMPMVLMTEFASAVRTSALGARVDSLASERFRILGAIDVLTGSG
ncbi:CcdB family protein [Sphingomonas hengshuiensis]|uniref:Toxin CcdB n=1 Tax=Sphingomonas hengshuiensis TaxID=1609977 RepID=A0A7U4LGJ5_9SPHN|nr:CcdB family protein [Sphingomonas hengshuiensis]AJP73632.1 CcdB-like protein [Sphingomonas hengshuiensis]